MASKNKQSAAVAQAIAKVGPVLTLKQAEAISKQTKTNVGEVMSSALKSGIGLGANLVNSYGKPGAIQSSGNYYGKPDNLKPLQGLTLQPGQVYMGATTYTTPATSNKWSGHTNGSTTYNPIISQGAGQGSTAGNRGASGNGNDPFQDLQNQVAAAQQTITDLQNRQLDPYPQLSEMLAAQQQAMQEQAAQQQKALQDLMIQQQQAYETQMADARKQQEAMAAQAAEAQRQAMAVANARVPGLEPTATAPTLGDSRDMTRSAAANTLSNLSILTGMGISGGVTATPAAPLAGLQIA